MHKNLFYVAIGLLILGILSVSLSFYWQIQRVEVEKQNQLATLLSDTQPLSLGTASKVSDCQVNGPKPDPDCTPGAVFSDVTKEQICVPGYSKTVRSVSTEDRKQVYAKYGISYPQTRGDYEVDHFIPLALGGSNDIANLWLEAAQPAPGFKEKDIVEVYLYEELCAGRVALNTAQQQISDDWVKIYNGLSLGRINELKNKYQNWTN